MSALQNVILRVHKENPALADRLMSSGSLRALFDPSSAEWQRLDMAERKKLVIEILACGIRMKDIELAFLDLMERQGWSGDSEKWTFLDAMALMLMSK